MAARRHFKQKQCQPFAGVPGLDEQPPYDHQVKKSSSTKPGCLQSTSSLHMNVFEKKGLFIDLKVRKSILNKKGCPGCPTWP